MPARTEIAPELLAEARRLYEQTVTPLREIWTLLGVSRSTLYARARESKWERRRHSPSEAFDPPAADPARDAPALPALSEQAEPVTPERQAALRARLFRVAENKMATIERILRTLNPVNEAQSERSARIMASLRQSISQIDELTRPERRASDDATDKDAFPRDLDELRSELARRIDAFVEANASAQTGGDPAVDGGLDRS
jgi:hypothetical protein